MKILACGTLSKMKEETAFSKWAEDRWQLL
jgi:hypothetical protein